MRTKKRCNALASILIVPLGLMGSEFIGKVVSHQPINRFCKNIMRPTERANGEEPGVE